MYSCRGRASEAQRLTAKAAGQGGGDIPFQVAVHDGEENLQKEVDGVDEYRQEVQPSFSGHHDGLELLCED